MGAIVTELMELGFSQYEAEAYIALLQHGPQNGYELAKASGIPRANIYNVLKKLEERSAVLRQEAPDGTQYAAVPSAELLDRLRRKFQASFEHARQALEQVQPPAETAAVLNALGYPALLEHARAVISQAERKLLLAVFPSEAQALQPEIEQAQARGVQVSTLCLAGCPAPCPSCQGRVHRFATETPAGTRWLLLVPDERQMLAGEMQPGASQVVRTQQQLLVNLAAEYIRQTIALASILQDLKQTPERPLSSETQATLQALYPKESWLQHIHHLMSSGDLHNEHE